LIDLPFLGVEGKLDQLAEKVSQSPDNLFFSYSYAQGLFKAGQWIESIEQFKICTEGRPDWMMAFFSLAEAQISAGLEKEAVQSLVTTIDLARKQGHDDPLEEASNLLASLKSQSSDI
jgi:predicted Zn-dependent protease